MDHMNNCSILQNQMQAWKTMKAMEEEKVSEKVQMKYACIMHQQSSSLCFPEVNKSHLLQQS